MSGGGHSEVAKRRLRIQHVIDERTCVDARARYHQFSFVVPITQHLPLLCLKAIPVTLRRGETQVRIKYRFNFSSPSSQFLYKIDDDNQSLQSKEPVFVDSSGPFFTLYSEAAEDEDNKMVKSWQDDVKGILIFVSFSVRTHFVLCINWKNRLVYSLPQSLYFSL